MAVEKKGYYSLSEFIQKSIEFENDSADTIASLKPGFDVSKRPD